MPRAVEFGGAHGDRLILYAEPNTTGNPRQMEMRIEGDFSYQTITVRQEG